MCFILHINTSVRVFSRRTYSWQITYLFTIYALKLKWQFSLESNGLSISFHAAVKLTLLLLFSFSSSCISLCVFLYVFEWYDRAQFRKLFAFVHISFPFDFDKQKERKRQQNSKLPPKSQLLYSIISETSLSTRLISVWRVVISFTPFKR